MPPVDYRPLTATEHRSRWAAAVSTTWDFSDLPRGSEVSRDRDRPGVHPENVFDFHDGMRLIVSVDRYGDDSDHLHVSASARPDSKVGRAVKARRLSLAGFCKLVEERLRFLRGQGTGVSLGYVTQPKGIPHFFDPPLSG